MKRKSEDEKRLEADVKKAISKYIEPNQAMIDWVVKKMVDESHYRNAHEMLYSLIAIEFDVKAMVKHALIQTFGGK